MEEERERRRRRRRRRQWRWWWLYSCHTARTLTEKAVFCVCAIDLGPPPAPEVGETKHFSVELSWDAALREVNGRSQGAGVVRVVLQRKDQSLGHRASWTVCYKSVVCYSHCSCSSSGGGGGGGGGSCDDDNNDNNNGSSSSGGDGSGSNGNDNNINNKKKNNDDNWIERRNSRFLQSPHCAANNLQYVRCSGQGAIVFKSRATHRALILFYSILFSPWGNHTVGWALNINN